MSDQAIFVLPDGEKITLKLHDGKTYHDVLMALGRKNR